MIAKKDQDEPTMEEILASIRRIISEEGEPEKDQPETCPVAPEPVTSFDPGASFDPVAEDDEILELTDILEDDLEDQGLQPHEPAASPESLQDAVDALFDADPAPEVADDPAPVPEEDAGSGDFFDLDAEFESGDMVDPADEHEAIVTEEVSSRVRASFGQLSDLLVAGYSGSNNTLEGMVREMLKPMLREWLDQNLPRIVERTVAREIARLARVKKP